MNIKNSALNTLRIEAEAVSNLSRFINDDFEECVRVIHSSSGRIVLTGIGKSANIAIKLVATLNSTGSPALFMHAADAIHGDLGIVQEDDVVICISKSGSSPEIKVLIPLVKNMGNTLIGMVGNMESPLAKQADYVLNTTVEKEADPNNLAPTASTTAQLAMGDALAICLMEMKGFGERDFARYHPGGALGKKLFLKVADLVDQDRKPAVQINSPIKEVILEISKNRLGATAVMDDDKLVGVITDGDLRRMLESGKDVNQTIASDIMGEKPKTIASDAPAVEAFHLLEKNNITQALVLRENSYFGIIHIHDILKEGIY
jgi:arabinose-5-phosphate isomerase